uniref:Uncharacterized protein n=1 Tax=Equus asinus asinus TaxID=83772 RepID=A0A8C4LYC4_EQUAS
TAVSALEHCGGVDFLVCVAGVNPLVGSTLGASEQVWNKILDVNVKAPALLLRPGRGGGGGRDGACGHWIYNTSKTALLGLCKSLAVELAPKGIRVNCLVPGIIKTDFIQVVRITNRNEKEDEMVEAFHLEVNTWKLLIWARFCLASDR